MTRSHHRLVPLVGLVSQSIKDALARRAGEGGESVDHLIRTALADTLQLKHATLFRVSTAPAAVEGVSQAEMTVAALRAHGDFGIGTLDGYIGEMVLVDGQVFQIRGGGSIAPGEDTARTPFALVTRFRPETTHSLEDCRRYGLLQRQLDAWRTTDECFYAVRVEGRFDEVLMRAATPGTEEAPLTEGVSASQDENRVTDIAGVLVGFWSPAYVTALTVPGYHLHFLDEARRTGGHLVDVRGRNLTVAIQRLTAFHVCLPETADFLAADLRLGRGAPSP
ncbi:MAG: acetolactate decarboxylase [Rhodospirillales bacterium]